MKEYFLLFLVIFIWNLFFEKKRGSNTKKNVILPRDIVKKQEQKINIVPKNEGSHPLSSSSLQKGYTKQDGEQKHKISSMSYLKNIDIPNTKSSYHPIRLKKELLINKNKIRKCIIVSEILQKKY